MGEDVDGLVVEVEEGEERALEVEDGAVVVEDVLVELQVLRHLVPLPQPERPAVTVVVRGGGDVRLRGLPRPVRC